MGTSLRLTYLGYCDKMRRVSYAAVLLVLKVMKVVSVVVAELLLKVMKTEL